MSWRDRFRSRARREAELEEEIRAHLRMAIADRIARGESPRAAERAARREFGDMDAVRQATRAAWGGGARERAWYDVRIAFRSLRRSPGFTVTALLTLALGTGLTTTVFSVMDGVALRPLAFPEPGRLITLCERYPGATADWCSASPPDAEDIAREAKTLTALGIARGWSSRMDTPEGRVPIRSGIATPGMFAALAVAPEAGRVLEAADLVGGPGRVAVITHEMWRDRFGGASNVVGRAISIDGQPVTIVGVMPPGFRVPKLEFVELWRPLHLDPRAEENRAWPGFVPYGRLAPGASLGEARTEIAGIAARLKREHFAASPEWGIGVDTLHHLVVGSAAARMALFFGAVLLVLLISCANVANLMLARGTVRGREVAVRSALGAGSTRIARSLLLEGLLLSLGGAAVGVMLAVAGTSLFRHFAPAGLPRVDQVGVDLRVLGFSLLLAIGTTLGFALLPALRQARGGPDLLLQTSRTYTARSRTGSALVIAEIALALVLLTGAGLLMRTFTELTAWSPGFEQEHLLSFSLLASEGTYRTRADVDALWVRAAAELRSLPGVVSVGTASGGPLFGGRETGEAVAEAQTVRWFDVSPGFFAALGVPIVRGRDLDDRDVADALPTVMVNESLAARLWPGEDGVGRTLTLATSGDTTAFAVVGVVHDVRPLRPGDAIESQVYWSNRQRPRWFTYVVVRTRTPPADLLPDIRRRLAAVDPDLAPGDARTLPELLAQQLGDQRFFMLLLGAFGLAALALAAVGTYGLLGYLVSRRRREIGIRVALGADRGRILRQVAADGMLLALEGIGLGLALSLLLGRMLRGLVAGVSTRDPATLAVACAVLAAAAFLAVLVPARRASSVSPLVALEND